MLLGNILEIMFIFILKKNKKTLDFLYNSVYYICRHKFFLNISTQRFYLTRLQVYKPHASYV